MAKPVMVKFLGTYQREPIIVIATTISIYKIFKQGTVLLYQCHWSKLIDETVKRSTLMDSR